MAAAALCMFPATPPATSTKQSDPTVSQRGRSVVLDHGRTGRPGATARATPPTRAAYNGHASRMT